MSTRAATESATVDRRLHEAVLARLRSQPESAHAFRGFGPLVLAAKMIVIALLIFWFRVTYPRFREDQLQTFAWKFLIPVALANIAVTAIIKVAV